MPAVVISQSRGPAHARVSRSVSERLFSRDGNAALMVGAGFSRNATPNSTNSKPFPTWNDLGDIFFEKVNGRLPNSEDDGKYLNAIKE